MLTRSKTKVFKKITIGSEDDASKVTPKCNSTRQSKDNLVSDIEDIWFDFDIRLKGNREEEDPEGIPDTNPVKVMATKDEIEALLKRQEYLKMATFQPVTYHGQANELAQDFLSQYDSYIKIANIKDAAEQITMFELLLKGLAKHWYNTLPVTLIDNILTNVYDDKHVSGILINKISDHQPIFTWNNKATPLCKESKYIQIETKDKRSLSRFLDDLQDADIINKLDQNTLSDPNKNYDTFIEIVVSAKAKHLPTRRVKFNRRKHRIQMWVTKGIIKSINTKDKMYKKLVQSRCDSDLYGTLKAHFNKYRNILKKTIAKAKRIYYVDVFNRFKNNIKQTWKVIKETLHKNNFAKISKRFRHNGKITVHICNDSKRWRNCIAPSDAHLLMNIPHSKYSNNKQWNISR